MCFLLSVYVPATLETTTNSGKSVFMDVYAFVLVCGTNTFADLHPLQTISELPNVLSVLADAANSPQMTAPLAQQIADTLRSVGSNAQLQQAMGSLSAERLNALKKFTG